MAINSNEIKSNQKKRGGARDGAGRKGLAHAIQHDPRYLVARGYNPLFASQVLEQVIDERRTWKRILSSPDDRIVLDAMKFLMAMRDGKPAQSVNLTSTNINISSSDINKARAIVQEIRQSFASEQTATLALPTTSTGEETSAGNGLVSPYDTSTSHCDTSVPRLGDSAEESSLSVRVAAQVVDSTGIMLFGGEGVKKDG